MNHHDDSTHQDDRRLFLTTSMGALALLGSGCDLLAQDERDKSETAGPKSETASDPEVVRKAAEANDVTLLNKGIELEQGAINVYTAAAGLPFIAADEKVLAVAALFKGQHEEHRDALKGLVEQLGGTPIDPATAPTPEIPPAVLDEAATPEDRKVATLRFARKLERLAADTYFQLIVQQLQTDVARRAAANILPVEAQHVSVYDVVLGEAAPVNAALFTEQT